MEMFKCFAHYKSVSDSCEKVVLSEGPTNRFKKTQKRRYCLPQLAQSLAVSTLKL